MNVAEHGTMQTLYRNGSILTVDEQNHSPEAVLTDGEHIVGTGRFLELRAKAGDNVRLVDLAGKTMIPAFIDPHGHFPDSGFLALHRADLSGPPIGECRNLEDVFDRLSVKAAETAPGDWVIGAMFEPGGLEENRFPTRGELDRISTNHPIWVVHISGHAGVANSRALAFRGIDDTSPDPVAGRFGRDTEGRLDGFLEGMAGMGELGDTEFQMSYEKFVSAFEASAREYLSQGVTMAQNAWATRLLLEHFCRYGRENDPALDVMVLPPGFMEPKLSRGEQGIDLPTEGAIKIGPRKFFGDGSFHLQTACQTLPYHKPLNGDPAYRCELAITKTQMVQRLARAHDLGFQCHIHANGDATADLMLDAIAELQQRNPRDDHRHTLIHSQTLREDQLDRMAELGVTVSFFPAHLYYWGEFHRDVTLGPDRVQNMCPTRWAADRGIRFTIHNDASVTPTLPLHLMGCAVERKTANGAVIGEGQALSPLEALRAHTIDAAWQVFQEEDRGSIEVGKRADFAVLSGNPLDPELSIGEITVVNTIRAGKTVYACDA